MMAKDRAEAAANALVAQERAAIRKQKDKLARKVPFYLRVPEMSHLSPWQKHVAAAQVERRFLTSRQNWRLAGTGMIALAAVLFASQQFGSHYPVLWYGLLAAALAGTRVWLLRRALKAHLTANEHGLENKEA